MYPWLLFVPATVWPLMLLKTFHRPLHSVAFQTRSFASRKAPINKVSLTLYAKEGCSLCDKAKVVLKDVLESGQLQNKVQFTNVDITDPLNKQWWEAYCFDVPVIHIDRFNQKDPVKMMHYLDKEEVIEELNKSV